MINNFTKLVGRAGLAAISILCGLAKLGPGYEATQGYMEAMGVSGTLLPVVILVEIVGGLALVAGFYTRWAAICLAVLAVAGAFLFPFDFGDQRQFINFVGHIAIAVGFLMVAAYGPGCLSLDRQIADRRAGPPHPRRAYDSAARSDGHEVASTDANVPSLACWPASSTRAASPAPTHLPRRLV